MLEQNPVEVYQFRFFLKGISPLIWRRLLMTSNSSISDLHYAIQISMGWEDEYLNRFNIWGKEYGVYHDGGMSFPDDPEEVYLQDFQFRINEKFIYEYNFFASWEHEIRLEKILPFDSKKIYPLCVGGCYVAPLEDCRGSKVFMELMSNNTPWQMRCKLLEIIEESEEEEEEIDTELLQETIESFRYWITRHEFDRKKVNQQLQRYFNSQDDQLTVEEVYYDED